ncbi:YrbL family protein [Pinirhizobacter sp.]|jgi:hypothetical protein|uniref:YrbL family protein n=1 Tax=Pinirhizobacter sp. TaxID=2950432 RepID=UPI002F4132E7
MILLSGLAPVATGHIRYVYQHPTQADLLIKVMRQDAIVERWENGPWYRRLTRAKYYKGYIREFREFVTSYAVSPNGVSPLARVVGIELTDMGLGQVVEKVVAPDGSLAPTLDAWVRRDGYTPQVQAALDDFLARLLEHDTIAADLHAWNVVYGSDSRGGPHLLMIDGFGEKNIIPHQSMSRRHNRNRTIRRFNRMVERTKKTPREG